MKSLLCALYLVSVASMAQPSFETQTLDSEISIGYGLAIGDVDGDKKLDILLADKKQFVWYRNGDWKKFVLAENLTPSDNVCIAARDIDGDGKVEIAVGAQWNPGETSDTVASGSVHYLQRPSNPTQRWSAITLHHEPTVHRMKWVMVNPGDYRLVVVPLHGRGNKNGEGEGVRVLAYQPQKPGSQWKYEVIDQSMHLTHNFEILRSGERENIAVAGKEGIKIFEYSDSHWALKDWHIQNVGVGEVRQGSYDNGFHTGKFIATIEPMHGTRVAFYGDRSDHPEHVLDSTYNQGHALACANLIREDGYDQIIAGWREPDKNGKTGIRIFTVTGEMRSFWLDEGGIACEDLVVADLNADGKPDVIASGRATKNVNIYWNKKK